MESPRSGSEGDRLCNEGYVLLEAGRFEEAYPLLIQAKELEPNTALVHYRLGLLFLDTGRFHDALQAFDAALALDQDNVRAHNNRGSALQQLGRLAEAEVEFRQAVLLAPDQAIPYVNLGKLLEQVGRSLDAAEIYQQGIARGADPATLGHFHAAVTGNTQERAPEAWARATFDNFAPQFDDRLQALQYDAPQVLSKLLIAQGDGPFDIVDLGCGTGLCGVELAPYKRRLIGVDLSPKMAQFARNRAVYDDIAVADIGAWLSTAAAAQFDMAIAADVFIYMGRLEHIFADLVRVLRPGGLFAFSTEECDDDDYRLLPSGRFAQSRNYIDRLAHVGFGILAADAHNIRIEDGAPVTGRLYLLRRS